MTAYAITDSATMLRRSLRRMRRYPSLTFFTAALPVILLLLFVYVFGGTLGAGLGGPTVAGSGRDAYLAYVVPGILLLTVVGAATGTAISVAMDMTAGIIARFRTMAIARGSVLAGHILGSIIQIFLALGLVVVVAVAIGYRPSAGPASWLAAAGLLVLTSVAVCALSVGLGLATDSVETASNTPMVLTLLLFLSSAFVPTASMPDRSAGSPSTSHSRRSSRRCAGCSPERRPATTGRSRSRGASRSRSRAISGRSGCTSACRRAAQRKGECGQERVAGAPGFEPGTP